ncbi:MAG: hypothetical protein ACPGNV_03290 [Mangrovicoccus sp.]
MKPIKSSLALTIVTALLGAGLTFYSSILIVGLGSGDLGYGPEIQYHGLT